VNRQRRNSTQWQRLIEEFDTSGQAMSEFCSTHDLNQAYFQKRRRQLRAGSRFVAVRTAREPTVVMVQIGDVSVRCSTETSPEWIARLASQLRG
jgi:hypothetical protein